ncbi:MAG: hypothetical protein O3A46_14455 [Candidatus Poribacteria bacterium]|nr:hypothetical protein [Candidatus Poribacteria bacterium]
MPMMSNLPRVAWLVLAAVVAVAGCQSAVTVPIRVQVESTIDVKKYPTVAVLPFIDVDDRLDREPLNGLTDMMQQRLSHVSGMTVISQSITNDLMAGELLTEDSLIDPSQITNWGGMLGVSAVAVGTVRYYTLMQPEQRYVERYSYQLQRYVTERETALIRSFHLRIDMKLYDATTGEPLLSLSRSRRDDQAQSPLSAVVSELGGSTNMLLALAGTPIREFARRVAPHFDFEERYLAK